jgi:hypothetical protein
MAFSAVAEAQGSSRAQIRSDRQSGFTRPLEIPREPRWGLRQALLSTCEQAMMAASPDRRARRIKAAGVEARSPFDQGLRESPSLMTKNAREDAGEPAHSARPSITSCGTDAGLGRPRPDPERGPR